MIGPPLLPLALLIVSAIIQAGWVRWFIRGLLLLLISGIVLGNLLWYRVGRIWVTPTELRYRTFMGRIRRWPRSEITHIGLGQATMAGRPVGPQVVFENPAGKMVLRIDAVRWATSDLQALANVLQVSLEGEKSTTIPAQYAELLNQSKMAGFERKSKWLVKHSTLAGLISGVVALPLTIFGILIYHLITTGRP